MQFQRVISTVWVWAQDWIWASRGRTSGMNTSGIDTSGIYEFQYLKTVLFSRQSEFWGKLMKPTQIFSHRQAWQVDIRKRLNNETWKKGGNFYKLSADGLGDGKLASVCLLIVWLFWLNGKQSNYLWWNKCKMHKIVFIAVLFLKISTVKLWFKKP